MNIGTLLLAPYHAIEPRSQAFGPTVVGTPGNGKLLALTYDDGPNPRWTPELLDLLQRHGVSATFFVVGKYVEQEPQLVRRAVSEGHALGNHTYSHTSILRLSREEIASELARCAATVEHAGCEFSELPDGKLCRPPYGRKRPAALRAVRESADAPLVRPAAAWDWSKRAYRRHDLAARGQADPGRDAILLHDGDGDHGMDGPERGGSLVATERIIERFGGEGFEFVTIPELVART